jgi:hypothetical protein
MDTILYALLIPVVFSVLFTAVRIYFLYFAKPKCSSDCKCDNETKIFDDEVVPVVEKPKRTRRPKQGAKDLGDFAVKATDKLKKPRKKKS